MNATNQCNSKDFIFVPAEAQTQCVLLSQLLLLVSKFYVNLYFQKTTFLQQGFIKACSYFWQVTDSLWPVHFVINYCQSLASYLCGGLLFFFFFLILSSV